MKKNHYYYFLLIFCIIISCFLPQLCQCKNQGQALAKFYKAKLAGSNSLSSIDKSRFKAVDIHRLKSDIHPQDGLKEKDRITRLPGQPEVGFSQYGGYVTVNKAAGRAFYYYFVEADKSSENNSLPLLLWLNGGPGCSSLAYGAMQELGPFRVHSDGKTLYRNRYSWNNAANVLFVESPGGVGFSYSNTTSDYSKMGDKETAEDNYVFIVNWLERFKEYKGREFYIAGESYAGHYVPQLAHTILNHNNHHNHNHNLTHHIINLKGIMIGNAVINDETDTKGMYDYFATHALISDESVEKVHKYCDFSPNATTQSDECDTITNDVENNIYHLDIYNIYAPLCSNSTLTVYPKKTSLMNFDPCSDNYVYAYLNRPDVQRALHANVTKISYDWEPCSDVLKKWRDSPSSVIPLLKDFMDKDLRVWIFSGDTDARVPVTSTKYSIETMKLPIKTSWHPWYLGGEVGGYTQVYKGDLTFATVRGAGHQVPSYQPKRALSLISHFLNGSPLPDTTRYS